MQDLNPLVQTQYPLNTEWIIVDEDKWDKNAETVVGDHQTRINKQFEYLKSKIEVVIQTPTSKTYKVG